MKHETKMERFLQLSPKRKDWFLQLPLVCSPHETAIRPPVDPNLFRTYDGAFSPVNISAWWASKNHESWADHLKMQLLVEKSWTILAHTLLRNCKLPFDDLRNYCRICKGSAHRYSSNKRVQRKMGNEASAAHPCFIGCLYSQLWWHSQLWLLLIIYVLLHQKLY